MRHTLHNNKLNESKLTKIDAFWDFSSRHREQHGTAAIVTCLTLQWHTTMTTWPQRAARHRGHCHTPDITMTHHNDYLATDSSTAPRPLSHAWHYNDTPQWLPGHRPRPLSHAWHYNDKPQWLHGHREQHGTAAIQWQTTMTTWPQRAARHRGHCHTPDITMTNHNDYLATDTSTAPRPLSHAWHYNDKPQWLPGHRHQHGTAAIVTRLTLQW